ncbi:MAG TPA: 2-C-methyl-D-erythritol 4-phosphate cytidylyltransferase [Pyrinomonadaceae bacterium]|jgi:2-C-methyl-D-erythritol 4-phosphate cytidylyltransferase|nr:2-C-methyl-D-erythritol 4-phosphate cytidylyltransferase [Pyrinomonadaceae bacterium]
MNTAIIAAAGRGNRMASDRPKQFLLLAGTPIVVHTLKRFEECESIQEIIVVLPAEESAGFLSMVGKFGLRKLVKVVPGGSTRADSVKRGLMSIRAATADIVAVHDGVRPFVAVEEIERTVAAARETGAAILVGSVVDTIKEINGDSVVRTLNRKQLRRALTPQCFRYDLLKRAFENIDVNDPSITDESFLVEKLGERVAIVEGSPANIKITTKQDLLIAEAYLRV